MFPTDYTDYFNVCDCERNEVQRGNLSHFLADYADFFSVMLSEVEASLGIAKRCAFALKIFHRLYRFLSAFVIARETKCSSYFLADYTDYADFFSVMLSEVEASLGIAKRSAFALKSLPDFSNIQ